MKYEDGSIRRNVHVTELNILEAHDEKDHPGTGGPGMRDSNHPPVKKGESSDKDKDKEEKEAAAPGMRDEDKDKKKEDQASIKMKETVDNKIQTELRLRKLVRQAILKSETKKRK